MKNAVLDAYRETAGILEEAGIADSHTDARFLVEAAFGVSVPAAVAGLYGCIPDDAGKKLSEMTARRISGVPLQYILGSWDFMGLTFSVGEGVLIPRSETEVLVEYALNELKVYEKPVVFDLCSGSGCIGLSLSRLSPSAQVYLVEKSDKALKWLEKNVHGLGLDGRVTVVQGDIFDCGSFDGLPQPDAVISNPPYIESGELPGLQREVRREPSMALDGGSDGLDFYRCLCENWFPRIKPGGLMALECGENQSGSIARMFPEDAEISVFNDYCGVDRFVSAKKNRN